MHQIYLVPQWFIGYDIIMQIVFGIITLLVALKAFNVYKVSSQNQAKLFGNAFLLISLSYFVQAILNIFIMTEINEQIDRAIDLLTVADINNIAIFIHIFLFLIGLITLAYMTLDIKSIKAYTLILVLCVMQILLSSNKLLMFYVLSSILLLFIMFHYLFNFFKHKRLQTLIVFIAFSLLLFGSVHFIISIDHSIFYVIGHFLGLIAYILIMVNLMMVGGHEQKKRSVANNS